MRINPPLAVLLLVSVAFGLLAWMHYGEQEGLQEARCKVARSYLEMVFAEKSDRPLFFAENPVSPLPMVDIDKFLASPDGRKYRNDPDLPLYRQQQRLGGQSLVARCENVRTLLSARKIPHAQLSANTMPETKDGLYPFEYIGISMPAVDLVHGKAIFEVDRSSGFNIAGGSQITMRRNRAGKWQITDTHDLWVS
jgi:hypothetical protein